MTDDLIAWLHDQLDNDERVAKAAAGLGDRAVFDPYGYLEGQYVEHITRWEPARVLADVAAKRRIIDAYADAIRMERAMNETDDDAKWDWMFKREALEGVVHLLAQPYADHPGYREEWRP